MSANIQALRENGQSDDTFDVTLHYVDKVVKLGSSAFQASATCATTCKARKAAFSSI